MCNRSHLLRSGVHFLEIVAITLSVGCGDSRSQHDWCQSELPVRLEATATILDRSLESAPGDTETHIGLLHDALKKCASFSSDAPIIGPDAELSIFTDITWLDAAAIADDVALMQTLLAKGHKPGGPVGTEARHGGVGLNTLHLAAAAQAANAVKLLLDHGVKADIRDSIGETPLMYSAALSSNGRQTVEVLLTHGADPSATDLKGRLVSDLAAEAGDVSKVFTLLVAGAKVGKWHGEDPQSYALAKNWSQVAAVLKARNRGTGQL